MGLQNAVIKSRVAGNLKMGSKIQGTNGTIGTGITAPGDAAIGPDLGNGVTDAVQEHQIRKTAGLAQGIEREGEKETAIATAVAVGRGAGSEMTRGGIGEVARVGAAVEAGEAQMAGPRDGKLDLKEGITPGPAMDRVSSNVLAHCLPRMTPLLSARAKNQRSRWKNLTLGTPVCSRQPPTL
jgi:hypothetical protein